MLTSFEGGKDSGGMASVIGDIGGSGSPRDLASLGSRSASASMKERGGPVLMERGEREGNGSP